MLKSDTYSIFKNLNLNDMFVNVVKTCRFSSKVGIRCCKKIFSIRGYVYGNDFIK